jgi:hypothetical protein
MPSSTSAYPDPPFDEIVADLGMASLLDAPASQTEQVRRVLTEVVGRSRRGGTQLLGLHLAFIALAEALAKEIGKESLPGYDSFDNTKKRAAGAKAVDTLTILLPQGDGKDKRYGIRRWVNLIIDVFKGTKLRRSGYPSSPMQHTKRWTDWTSTLDTILGMTRAERRALGEDLYAEVLELPKDIPRVVARTVQDPFVRVILEFSRKKQRNETAGAALQGLAYGYVCADAPELTPRSASVHTGARRAGLIGDVDAYDGPFLQLAVEVKDRELDDFDSALTDFLSNLAGHPNVTAYVICLDATDDVRTGCRQHDMSVLTVAEMAEQVRLWTVSKQARAVREALAYYQTIEHSPALSDRYVKFLKDHGIDLGMS